MLAQSLSLRNRLPAGEKGEVRVIYLANLPDRVLVLHAFQKKTQQTPQKDIDLAAGRLREWKA